MAGHETYDKYTVDKSNWPKWLRVRAERFVDIGVVERRHELLFY